MIPINVDSPTMLKKCNCGYLYETTWQSMPTVANWPYRRLRKEEGPWEEHVSKRDTEMKIVKSYLYNRMRILKRQDGSKHTVQIIQQEIDHVRELAQ